MYYHSINLDFGQGVDPVAFLGPQAFETVKDIANSLGSIDIKSLFSAFSDSSFCWEVPDTPVLSKLRFNRKTCLEAVRELNGSITWYEMAKLYVNNTSDIYNLLRSKSRLRVSTVLSMIPEGYSIGDALGLIEAKAERRESKVVVIDDGYFYDGIPSEIFIATWMKAMATGIDVSLSYSQFSSALEYPFMNPKMNTLRRIAEYWGMGTGSFVEAIEKGELVLAPEDSPIIGDNSKKTIIGRIIKITGYKTWHELALSFPKERQIAVRNFSSSMKSDLNVYTLLSILKPFGLRLSDVIE